MKCPSCGREVREGTGACAHCGVSFDSVLGRRTDFQIVAPRPEELLLPDEGHEDEDGPVGDLDGRHVEARCLLSSILSEPIRLEDGCFYRIGRDRTSDICLPSTHVSRIHAEVTQEGTRWVVGDLGSRNGTFVNGERVFKRTLEDGDRIGIGHFKVLYREVTRSQLEELRRKKPNRMVDTLKMSQDAVGFYGDLRKLSVVEVVQLLGQNRKTGVLSVHEEKGAPERRLHFLDGAIVHAEFGSLASERAVQPILRTRTGLFSFHPSERPEKITIDTPTATLLLQAAADFQKPSQVHERRPAS